MNATRALPAVLTALAVVQAGSLAAPSNDDCLACHDPAAELTRADGAPLAPDLASWSDSVHGFLDLACVDCHVDVEEVPHAEKLAPADCSGCHPDVTELHRSGVHGREGSVEAGGAACHDCHGAHDILPSNDPASRTFHLNVPATCQACHGADAPAEIQAPRPGAYDDSIHGRALLEAGLVVAPNCATCHGAHGILPSSDPESRVAPEAVPAGCGSCHVGILAQYERGVHGKAVAAGVTVAPACATCHPPHEVMAADLPEWRLAAIGECGTCHRQSLHTYRDTFHGKVTQLGFSLVAACADCHDAHEIYPTEDPRSPVSAARRVETCRKCHPQANANFAQYDPHPEPDNPDRNPVLYWSKTLMQGLLIAVFGFFFLHTGLWFQRELFARRGKGRRR